uniref:Uncharacterized protein n=1 Tax=Romanomermis culicivorax TaxID=13658 RepID=A0A915IXJ9_ROMCU
MLGLPFQKPVLPQLRQRFRKRKYENFCGARRRNKICIHN